MLEVGIENDAIKAGKKASRGKYGMFAAFNRNKNAWRNARAK
jgi:hypothetical protein